VVGSEAALGGAAGIAAEADAPVFTVGLAPGDNAGGVRQAGRIGIETESGAGLDFNRAHQPEPARARIDKADAREAEGTLFIKERGHGLAADLVATLAAPFESERTDIDRRGRAAAGRESLRFHWCILAYGVGREGVIVVREPRLYIAQGL